MSVKYVINQQRNINLYHFFTQAMTDAQSRLQDYVDGFQFNLGFSGKFFHHGSPEENKGDDALIGKCHTALFTSMHLHA